MHHGVYTRSMISRIAYISESTIHLKKICWIVQKGHDQGSTRASRPKRTSPTKDNQKSKEGKKVTTSPTRALKKLPLPHGVVFTGVMHRYY